MIDHDLLSEILSATLSSGGEYADIYAEYRHQASIELEDNKIEKIITGADAGVGIRLIIDSKTMYAYCNDFSKNALFKLAGIISRAVPGDGRDKIMDLTERRSLAASEIKLFPSEIGIDRKINLVREANRIARAFDSRIKQATVIYRDSTQRVQIASSDGSLSQDERTYTLAVVQVIASDNGLIQTGYESAGGLIGFELFDNALIEGLALKASKRAIMMLEAKRVQGGRMPVVISSEAGGTMIHEAIGHGLEADLAQQGLSVYSNKIGEKVASPLVTVIDDSTIPQKRGSFGFDDEGTPSQKTVLVDKGILLSYMYDKLSSIRDRVKSTGNGRRQSYRHRPIPRMTNTFIAPGKSSPLDVLKSVQSGLFVTKMGGGQVNTVTGDFVFDVQEGYTIRNGERGELVRGATLSGNGPATLHSIDMVASDLGFSIGTCGKDSQGVPVSDAMPTIRIPEMVVGGKA